MTPKTLLIASVAMLGLAAIATGQTIDLSSGEVVIGMVTAVDERTVTVEVGYPEATTRTIPRGEIEPISMYHILAARVVTESATAHVELAEVARALGLPLHAIAEYREAIRRDDSMKPRLSAAIEAIRSEIADGLLEDASDDLHNDRKTEARLGLESIVAKYGDTKSGAEAKRMLAGISRSDATASTRRRMATAEAEETLKQIARHQEAADAIPVPVAIHGRGTEQRRLESVASHLQKAWKLARDAVVNEASDAGMADRLVEARETSRRRLVETALALGTIHLQRRAIPSAEHYCALACELDPDNAASHVLHQMILDAKLSRGGWWSQKHH